MTGREIAFTTDKYNNPVYLSKRESLAQIILNALFLKPGNIPSHPERGVDITKILNKTSDSINELQLLETLKTTCGKDLVSDEIESLSIQMVQYDDKDIALLILKLKIDNTDDLMAISIQREKDNVVRYQYNFINEDVPV